MTRVTAAFGSLVWLIAAPGVVCGLVPWLVTDWRRPDSTWPLLDVSAVSLCVVGASVMLHSFVEFAWHGRGTPAPPAPTDRLVIRGVYRHVRNPMYVAVVAMVLGQVLAFRSWGLLAYLIAVGLTMHAFVRTYEEPTLARVYGREYSEYKEAVPRWIPRPTRWNPAPGNGRPGA